jgi:hypothetical protein
VGRVTRELLICWLQQLAPFEQVRPYRCVAIDWTQLTEKSHLLNSVGKLNLSQFTVSFTQEEAAIPHFTLKVLIRNSPVFIAKKH